MTPEEREAKTKEILSQWSTSVQCGDYDVIWKRLETEIINPAIEEEREACARIVHEEYKMWEDEGFKVHECFRDAEKRIRARSS